jgi:Carbohydrate esterase, sialic acid-specific acetylesterase
LKRRSQKADSTWTGMKPVASATKHPKDRRSPMTHRLRFLSLLSIGSVLSGAACGSPVGFQNDGTGGGLAAGGLAAGGMAIGGTGTGSGASTGGAVGASGGASSGGQASGGRNSGGAPGSGGATAGGSGDGGAPENSGGAASGGSGDGGSNSGGSGSGGASSGVFHVFMLMGQSNMAGVAPREPGDANTDERLKVFGGCGHPAGQWSTATNPPLSECPGEKGWNLNNSVDPGIWFGKTLLAKLPAGDTIGLVGTAESGESLNTFVSGGSHHNMILTKIAGAKTAPNARFAGIIFHQGETDNTASWWPGKVVQLYNEVKEAWGSSQDVPMILGELPAGGCCSAHNTRVHEAADQLPMGYWISQNGTNVLSDGLHFDHASVVLMGERYGETMIEALGW